MVREGVVGQLNETNGQLEVEWQIADFLSLSSKTSAKLSSRMFFLSDSSWYLQLQVNTDDEKNDDGATGNITIFLMRRDSGAPKSVIYSLFLKTSSGRETIHRDGKNTFSRSNSGWGASLAKTRCQLIERKSEWMPSGVLTVICSLKCEGKRVLKAEEILKQVMKDSIDITDVETQTEINSVDTETQTETDTGPQALLDDIKLLVASGEHSDVTIRLEEEEFRLHTTILAARTPVFNATLQQGLKEKTAGVIPLADIEAAAFRDFVHYLYTGRSDLLSPENALGLFKMADKYQMDHLKENCLRIIKRRPISADTFVDVVELAFKHEMEELMERATTFLSENMAQVMITEKWHIFLKNNLKQANELLVQAAIRKDEST